MPLKVLSEERDERRIIIILYVGTLALLGILLYATYSNMQRYDDAQRSIRRYNYALLELTELFAGLQEQETGTRGYLLTNDTLFLQPYERGRVVDEDRFKAADSLLTDADWHAQLAVLRIKSNSVETQLTELVSRQHGRPRLEEADLTGLRASKIAMDELRMVHARITSQLRLEREAYLSTERDKLVDAPVMLILYSALAIAATALLFWRLSRALRNTEMAKSKLQFNLTQLDEEVKHRTSVQGVLQKVLDTSPNGIIAFRALRDRDGTLVDFEFLSSSRQANSLVKRDDLVGRRLLEEMPEGILGEEFQAFVNVVKTGIPYSTEAHYWRFGVSMWLAINAVRLEDGFMVIFSDITQQKRAQEVNTESDRIALTGQITRTVAHEVRNPLTNIHLAVEQLHDEVLDREEETGPFFQIIDRNLKRIGALINGMLESSKKRELNVVACGLEDIVNSALEVVKDRLALRGMKGESNVLNDLPDVLVDQELINLAITNITINAIEAMEAGIGHLRMGAYRAGDEVLMEITDNGKGIPAENLLRLFEPFYSGRIGGLGLGLTTARSILNSHRIKLELRSTVGEGTTFTLRFPSEVFAPTS